MSINNYLKVSYYSRQTMSPLPVRSGDSAQPGKVVSDFVFAFDGRDADSVLKAGAKVEHLLDELPLDGEAKVSVFKAHPAFPRWKVIVPEGEKKQ